jgi:hypothetical protein
VKANRWLTEADLAEIDVVSKVLVDAIFTHREKCSTCRSTGRYCTPIVGAIEAAVDWAELRTMTSKAEALRAMQNGRAT